MIGLKALAAHWRRPTSVPEGGGRGRKRSEGEDHRFLAILKQPQTVGRKISECIALAKAYEENLGYSPVPDENFARDVEEGISAHQEPIRNVWDEE